MLKRILIKEKASDRFVAEYRIDFENTSNLSEEDYCNTAWQNAIADELVNRDNRSDYRFLIFEDIPGN